MENRRKGKFIVMDGADGCGKQTQTKQLVQKLIELGYATETIDFPRYYDNFTGGLINGLQSDPDLNFSKMDPRIVSYLYAVDRFESKKQLEDWLEEGRNIVSDRYVSANQLHQGGKYKDEDDRKAFMVFLDKLEYGIFQIPRPDMIIYLDVPHELSVAMMKKNFDPKKRHLEDNMDEVEKDVQYQMGARASGTTMLQDKSWVRIQCSYDGVTIRTVQDIHEEILAKVLEIM